MGDRGTGHRRGASDSGAVYRAVRPGRLYVGCRPLLAVAQRARLQGHATQLAFGACYSDTLISTSTTGILSLVIGLPLVLGTASIGGDPAALSRIGKTT